MQGRVLKLGDNISTDQIIPGRFFHLRSDIVRLSDHLLNDICPNLSNDNLSNSFIVAGYNFGLGSSREHAPQVIKKRGVKIIIAKSFARIFFRNAMNLGLLLIECDTDYINHNDILYIDLEGETIRNTTTKKSIEISAIPSIMKVLYKDGGLIEHIKKNKDFKLW